MNPPRKRSQPPSNQSDGKTRIILAAEALFAEGGIDGVSLRQIAAKAGQGNHHAVQYHFGTRERLVQAIFDYRMLQMDPQRDRMLQAARASGMLDDPRTLMEIIFVPQLSLLDAAGNSNYARFLSQWLQRSHGKDFGDFGSELPPALTETLRLIRVGLTDLPERVAQRRFLSACFLFLNILASYGRGSSVTPEDEDFNVALADTLDQIVLATYADYKPQYASDQPRRSQRRTKKNQSDAR